MNYDLKRPCIDCPFLRGKAFLRSARARQIATDVLVRGQTFSCHKTLDYSGEGEPRDTKHTQHCAGALIMCENAGRPNQMMRIAERLGMYDASKLDMQADVYRTPTEMAAGHGKVRA
jgi:hypothetical protein